MDEDELMAELEELEAEQLDSELMEPAVPAKSKFYLESSTMHIHRSAVGSL